MKASDHFKNTIKAYLDELAETDFLFSFQYSKPEKNIDDCVNYILNTVEKSGCNSFADEEVYSMAVHYYPKYIIIQIRQFIIIEIQIINSFTCWIGFR